MTCNTVSLTAWKVSKYAVFSGPYFSAFRLNTERYLVSLGIQSECGKIRTRKNCVFGHFSGILLKFETPRWWVFSPYLKVSMVCTLQNWHLIVKGHTKCKIYIVNLSVSISLSRYEIQLSQNDESEDLLVSKEANNFLYHDQGKAEETIKIDFISRNTYFI